jgi:hypothetical protein
MSNALALAQWLPDTETMTPNSGDVVQVLAVPVNHTPTTQFAAAGTGGGGGGTLLPTATKAGQVMLSGTDARYSPIWGDIDQGNY